MATEKKTDDTNPTVTVSTPLSVTHSGACSKGPNVVSSQPDNKGMGSRRNNICSYGYYASNLRGDPHKNRSNCWSQAFFSAPNPSGHFKGVSKLPLNTQAKQTGQFRDRNEDLDSLVELKCGPRSRSKTLPPSDSSSSSNKQNNSFALSIRKDMYNLPDFQTDYEDAKFFVIKSYSEDDVHKSIKYSVWSSTVNGNKKLDAAYRDAEAKTLEDGKKRPIFLFFSVNASRQFAGLAEMVGFVDFKKDLDFWQVDKWNGFFPVEWHIVKDVPNWELRHIVLDNNEDKPVTHTRDTHEIKLKEGLVMLSIFKKYKAVTSLLDDMDFYEEREKALRGKKDHKLATLRMDYKEKDYDYEMEGDRRRMDQERGFNWSRGRQPMYQGRGYDWSRTEPSLIDLTKNLSLGGYSVSKKNTGFN